MIAENKTDDRGMAAILLTTAFICFTSDRELTWGDLENYDVYSANILSEYTNEVTLRTMSRKSIF